MIKASCLGSNRPLSGQLYKYTNVVKGWQQRWFAVDQETGILSYYLFDGPGDTVQPGQPARGEVIVTIYDTNVGIEFRIKICHFKE